MCVCEYVCMCACVWVCVHKYVSACTSMRVRACLCMHTCVPALLFVCVGSTCCYPELKPRLKIWIEKKLKQMLLPTWAQERKGAPKRASTTIVRLQHTMLSLPCTYIYGWPGPNVYTIYDRMFGDCPAKKYRIYTVYTWFWPTLLKTHRFNVYTPFDYFFGDCPAKNAVYTLHINGSGQPYLQHTASIYIHRLWPYIWWLPCQKHRMYTAYIWFWPTWIYSLQHQMLIPALGSLRPLRYSSAAPCALWQFVHATSHTYFNMSNILI